MKVVRNFNFSMNKIKNIQFRPKIFNISTYYYNLNKNFSSKSLFNISGFSSKEDLRNKTDLTIEFYNDMLSKEVNYFFNSLNSRSNFQTSKFDFNEINLNYSPSSNTNLSNFNSNLNSSCNLENVKILKLVRFLDNMSNDLCVLIDTSTALLSTLDENSTGIIGLKDECYETIMKISNFMNKLNYDVKLYNCICLSLISSNLNIFDQTDVVNLLNLMSKEIGSIIKEKNKFDKVLNQELNLSTITDEQYSLEKNEIGKLFSDKEYLQSLISGEEENKYLNSLKSFHILNENLSKSFEFLVEDLKKDSINNDILCELEITNDELNSLNSMGLKSMLSIHLEKYKSNIKESIKDKINNSNEKNKSNLALINLDILSTIICKSNCISLKKKAILKIYEICLNENDNKVNTLIELLKNRCIKSFILTSNQKCNSYMNLIHDKSGYNKDIFNILKNLWIRLKPNYLEEIREMIDELVQFINEEKLNLKNNDNKLLSSDNYLNELLKSENLSYSELKYLQTRFLELKYLKYINNNASKNINNNESNSNEYNNIIEKDFVTVGNLLNGFKILCRELFDIQLEYVMDDVLLEGEIMIHPSVLKCNIRRSNINYKDSLSKFNISNKLHNENTNIDFIIEKIKEMDSKEDDYTDLMKLYKRDIEGVLYFDLFVRDGKERQIFSHMTLIGSKLKGKFIQQPKSLIATNLEVVNRDLLNMSLNISNCKELLHEFGHAIHSLLSKTDFQSISGTRIPLQFAEIPSHFFEKFIYDYNFCKQWMIERHTNKPINTDLFNTLIYGTGENENFEINSLYDTIYNSFIDLNLHSFKFSKINEINEIYLIEILKRTNYFPQININQLISNKKPNKDDLKNNKLKAYVKFHEELNGLKQVENLDYNDIFDINESTKIDRIKKMYDADPKFYLNNIEFDLLYVFSPHLKDYPCLYYSYVIGKVYSLLIMENIQIKNLSLKEIGDKLNKEFLSRGNSNDLTELIKQIIN